MKNDSTSRWNRLLPWVYCGLIGVVAIGLRAALQPVLGNNLQFVIAFPAVVIAATFWGTGPGILVAVLCSVAVISPSVPPYLPGTDGAIQTGIFLIAAIVVCLVVGLPQPRIASDARESQRTGDEQVETNLIRWLRTVFWGSILVPLTAFISVSWWGYDRAESDAQAAAAKASSMILRQATRSFDLANQIAHRADAAAQAEQGPAPERERRLHQRLADMSGIPSIVNLNVWDRDGFAIGRSDRFPAGEGVSVSDREYFAELRDAPKPIVISGVLHGRQTGLALLNLAIRRTDGPEGFAGVVTVSLSPRFFEDYYRSLASEDVRLASFALMKTNGEILARWPDTAGPGARLPDGDVVFQRIQRGDASGELIVQPTSAQDVARFVSFRRVAELPLFVSAGFSRPAMFAGWRRFVLSLAAVLIPITLCLVYVSTVAIRRVRREQALGNELQQQVLGRARAEKSLLESQRLEALAQLTGGVAHDFNNLLAIISNSLHIQQRLHPEESEERQLQAIARAVHSGTRLTRQLLSFSRRQALQPAPVILGEWLPAAQSLIQSTLGSHVTLRIRCEPGTSAIFVDVTELELALINLALNAKHAMPEGGEMRIVATDDPNDSAEQRMVIITVEDTGVGIPRELLSRVFDPFYTTRPREGGSGLGLSQVYGFCQQAGGFVTIDSEVARGTRIAMHLPIATSSAQAPEAVEPRQDGAAGGNILLVEDNLEVAQVTAEVLRSQGLGVTHVPAAAQALRFLHDCDELPDVVLSDIEMPGELNGIALAFALRREYPKLPVLLITGYASQLEEARVGGLEVLAKPTPPDLLVSRLRSAMNRSH